MIESESVTVYRGDTDRKGNPNKTPNGSVEVIFSWGGLSLTDGNFNRQESAEGSLQVFVVKGSDVRARDRLERSNGQRYAVVGHSMWDQQAEFEVFGSSWIVFEVEAVNG